LHERLDGSKTDVAKTEMPAEKLLLRLANVAVGHFGYTIVELLLKRREVLNARDSCSLVAIAHRQTGVLLVENINEGFTRLSAVAHDHCFFFYNEFQVSSFMRFVVLGAVVLWADNTGPCGGLWNVVCLKINKTMLTIVGLYTPFNSTFSFNL
jgi:hypothetical protein